MMNKDLAACAQTQREHSRETNRRSLLTLATVGMGGLFSLPARAHHRNAAFGVETRSFPDLKKLGADRQIHAIRYASGSYHVVTADGGRAEFAEFDLRFKVDSGPLGPLSGKPVILPSGHVGDRAAVFFATPMEIGTFIKS